MIPSPIWLFQMWLFATFGPELGAFHPKYFEEACKDRPFEEQVLLCFDIKKISLVKICF